MLWDWAWESVLGKTITWLPHYTVKLPGLNIREFILAVTKLYVLKDSFFFSLREIRKEEFKIASVSLYGNLKTSMFKLIMTGFKGSLSSKKPFYLQLFLSGGLWWWNPLLCSLPLRGYLWSPHCLQVKAAQSAQGLSQPSQVYRCKDPARGRGDMLFNFQSLVQSKKGFMRLLVCITAEGMPALAVMTCISSASWPGEHFWAVPASKSSASAEEAQQGLGWHHLLLAREAAVLTWTELPPGLQDSVHHRFVFLTHLLSPLRDKKGISFSIIMALVPWVFAL